MNADGKEGPASTPAGILDGGEARYRSVLEQAPIAIALHRGGKALYLNEAHRRLFGYGRSEDLSALTVTDLVAPESRAEIGEQVRRRALGLPAETDYEFIGLRRDGTRFPALNKAVQIELEDGPATLVFHTDLTETRRATEALRASEARYRAVVELLREGVLVQRADGTIEACNPAAERILGFPSGALVGAGMGGPGWRAFREDGREFPPEEYPFVRAVASGEASPGVIMRLERPDRPALWLEVAATPLTRGPDGRPLTLVSTLTDLTAERRAAEHFRRREAFFHAALQGSPDSASVIGADRRYKFVSAGASNVLGWTEKDARVLDATSDLIHPDDRALVSEAFRKLVATPGQVVRLSYRHRHKDGSWRLLETMARNLLDDPDVQGVVANSRDATEQRRLEAQVQQAQKLEGLGRLAGGVAHDFNNILTVILSASEELRAAVARGEVPQAEDVEDIASAGRRARDITRQLLAFARRQAIDPQPIDLNAAIRGGETMLRRLLGEDVELRLTLPDGLWPVRADPAQLDQILINLLANARSALPRGGHVGLATANVEGQWVRLEVRDDGVGMTPEVKARIFEPFFTTREVGQGTGLGLATVHGIVTQAGGQIRVESEPARGTLVEILLPRSTGGEVPPQGEERRAGDLRGDETVLLVEDDPAVRSLARRALEGAGYRVLVAVDGADAAEQAGALQRPPDLVITDVVMPRLDGRRLAELLRARWPSLRVLFTSGYADDRLASVGPLIPGADLLQKPFTGAALLERVRSTLDRPAVG